MVNSSNKAKWLSVAMLILGVITTVLNAAKTSVDVDYIEWCKSNPKCSQAVTNATLALLNG